MPPQTQSFIGDAGEGASIALLRPSFSRYAKDGSGSPIDFHFFGLREKRKGAPLLPGNTIFRFQIKASESKAPKVFQVRRSTLDNWLSNIQESPVYIVYFPDVDDADEIQYLSLHDWLLSENGINQLASTNASIYFRTIDFSPSSKSINHTPLHESFLRENARAQGLSSAVWTSARPDATYPIDEDWFLKNVELATAIDPPLSMLERAAIARRYTGIGQISNPVDAEISEWLTSIRSSRNLVPKSNSFERRQFVGFVLRINTFENSQKIIPLPPFKPEYLNCWRAFVSIYPRSLNYLRYQLQNSNSFNDIKFCAALLPILSLGNDRNVSNFAFETLKDLSNRFSYARIDSLDQYTLVREVERCQVEAGFRKSHSRLVNLVWRTGRHSWERQFLSSYWPIDRFDDNLKQKLTQPTARDRNLRGLYEVMKDILFPTRSQR